ARLHIKRSAANIKISGIGDGAPERTLGKVTCTLKNRKQPTISVDVQLLILHRLTMNQPQNRIKISPNWTHLQGLELADPNYDLPGPVDILLGADVISNVLIDGIVKPVTTGPVAVNSIFGYLLCGSVPSYDDPLTITS